MFGTHGTIASIKKINVMHQRLRWNRRGDDLRNHEFIVYREVQCNIKYLVMNGD